jgi:hypothetical protein
MSTRESLARQQEALVAALVAGAEPPPGFDTARLDATRNALLNKRSGEVGQVWPRLAAALGPQWRPGFKGWAAGRPPRGSLRDGFDFARHLAAAGTLPVAAAGELAAREGYWSYDGIRPPRPRRVPAPLRHWLGHARVRRLTAGRLG